MVSHGEVIGRWGCTTHSAGSTLHSGHSASRSGHERRATELMGLQVSQRHCCYILLIAATRPLG